MTDGFWNALGEVIFSPKINSSELEEKIKAIKQKLPIPVFWLLGKTQSGKTSLIRALTGRSDAEIGNGFQPCTRTAQLYDFPNPEDCFLRFLDTRGLGEVEYDSQEDLQLFKQQAHLLIVVIKALDHAQQGVTSALRAIVQEKPRWPIIVVQTTLHEGYPSLETEHITPYPYLQSPLPNNVPPDLARSLLKQRQLFTGMNVHFVPVDFTLPNDGYAPINYGLDALWEIIEQVLPLGLRGMIVGTHREQLQDIYANAAHPHIITYALLAAGVAAIPVPFVGTPLVLSIQAKMFHALASLYEQDLSVQRFTEIGSTLGVSYLLGLGGRELTKLIPGYGSLVSSAYTGAVTYALGKTLCAYFSYVLDGDLPDKKVFAKIYAEELERGRKLLSEYLTAMQTSPKSRKPF